MRPDLLIQGVLSGVLGGRRKRSHRALRFLNGAGGGLLSNPQALLTAAGVAWGIFETLQNKSAVAGQPAGSTAGSAGNQWGDVGAPAWGAPSATSSGADGGIVTPPPIPQPGGANAPAPATDLPADALRMVRLAISAAHADGTINEHERAAIVQHAVTAGAADAVERELQAPRPLSEIVAGVTDPGAAATLYVLAYTILRADEQVSGAERIYLAQLANLLHLDAPTVAALEKDAGDRIDALGDQGQPGG